MVLFPSYISLPLRVCLVVALCALGKPTRTLAQARADTQELGDTEAHSDTQEQFDTEAQTDTQPPADTHAEAEKALIAGVQRTLDEDQEATRLWRRRWIGIQSGLLAGDLGLAALKFHNTGERAQFLLNASGSLLAVLSLLVVKPPALKAADELRDMPEATPEQRARKRAKAEELLNKSARIQALASGWVAYTGGLLVGLGIGIPLWFKYDRQLAGAQALTGSLALTAIQAATVPTGALREAEASRAQLLRPGLTFSKNQLALQLTGRW